MGLIACPDCGKGVSERVSKCIHCGAPLKSRDWGMLLVGLGCLALVSAFAYKLLLPMPTKQPVEKGQPSLSGGPYYESLMANASVNVESKGVFAIMKERALVMNRTLPRMVNPYLSLHGVNYRHSMRTMDYTYHVKGDLADQFPGLQTIGGRLQGRYCGTDEFALHRAHGVGVGFYYWDTDGNQVYQYSTRPCG